MREKSFWRWWYSNYLVFQTTCRYLKRVTSPYNHILSWKSNEFSDESIKPRCTSNNIFNPLLGYVGTKTRVEVKESCLKQDKVSFYHGKIVNIYIVYKINENVGIGSYPKVEICLFGAAELTRHTDIDRQKYSGYVIAFNRKRLFSYGNEIGRNVIIFGVDKISSLHIDNKKKDFLILGKGSTQGA